MKPGTIATPIKKIRKKNPAVEPETGSVQTPIPEVSSDDILKTELPIEGVDTRDKIIPTWQKYLAFIVVLLICVEGWIVLQNKSTYTSDSVRSHEETVTAREYILENKDAHSEIAIRLQKTGNSAVDQFVRSEADKILQVFVDENLSHSFTEEEKQLFRFNEGFRFTLTIMGNYSASKGYINYEIAVYTDTGGAHGNGYSLFLVFNERTGARVALHELFAPGTPYLQLIQDAVRPLLRVVLDRNGCTVDPTDLDASAEFPSEFLSGTAGLVENYENHFMVTQEGLKITFNPYQVAPYVCGSPSVVIPWKQIDDFLKQ